MDHSGGKRFFQSVLKAVMGISAEVFLTVCFMLLAFLVCALWWGIFK